MLKYIIGKILSIIGLHLFMLQKVKKKGILVIPTPFVYWIFNFKFSFTVY